MLKETLSFGITNNTSEIVPVSIFGNYGDPMDNANATTQYAWNLGSLTFGTENTISIQNKGVGASSFTITTVGFSGTTAADVVSVLNTLNLGAFFITTSGTSTIINNYNDNVVFGVLNIYNNAAPSLSYSFQGVGTGGAATIVNNTTATTLFSGTTPQTSALTGNLSQFVSNGDSITFSGNADNVGILVQVVRTNNTTFAQTNIFSSALAASAPFTYTFTASTGFSYLCRYLSP